MGPIAIRYAGLSSSLRRLGCHTQDIGNKTAQVAVSLTAARFGKSIL